jgi:hypothetical protein
MKIETAERFVSEFGAPTRDVVKVKSWNITNNVGVVLQVDQPTKDSSAYVWLPYPGEGQMVPDIALEYPGEAGRHSGTYPAAGLKRGEPALKLTITGPQELDAVVAYIRAMASRTALPEVRSSPPIKTKFEAIIYSDAVVAEKPVFIDPAHMPKIASVKPRREAIPRLVQREVWQRDGGHCVECFTKERLCFDHIVPFSKGGGNSVRNIQLLCEGCNLSKSNRI